jgi:hypothetical protein
LQTETVSAPWLLRLSWEELTTLAVCLALDLVELAAPMLLSPIIGDILDLTGFIFTAVNFSWFAAISLLEFLPGLDPVPFFTLTWLAWYIHRRRTMRRNLEAELAKWL